MIRLPTVLLFSSAATAAAADPSGYGHMMDGSYGGYGMIFGPVLWLLVLGAVIAGIVLIVRRTEEGAPGARSSRALAELDMRFAKGEIDGEEYASRKKLLAG